MHKIFASLFIALLLLPSSAFAFGTMIVTALAISATYGAIAATAMAFAINMVVSAVISKALYNSNQPSYEEAGQSPNVGNRQQVSPATDNKLPVIYGSSYVGGQVVDLSISENNQELYYVIALSEVTGTESGQTPSTFTFGDIYLGGKLVQFQGNGYTVASLLDESTGVEDTTVNGLMDFYLYRNGSNTPVNSPFTAIQIMQTNGLVYTWDATKLMSNCVFAILHMTFNQPANITGLQQTKFQITNSMKATGDCIYDYLLNTRYGGAIPASQIDTDSLDALTAYSEENFTYTPYSGGSATQKRFEFNGLVSTTRTIMQNLQDMASCCDCLLKYSEMFGTWGVIVQTPSYEIAIALNDSNIISGITTSTLDIANSFNIAEVKFPDNSSQDAFNTSIFDLAEIAPELLYPNEPINKQSISLPLTNNSITAQYLATRFLKSVREDLQLQFSINYIGLQLDAGDIVSVTNTNYGWTAKLFRCQKVTQSFSDSGQITTNLIVTEFNPDVYDDTNITQFIPAPNTGIGSPTFFGIPPIPTISGQQPTAINPSFQVNVTTSPSGIVQYAEIWYSAFSLPTTNQRIFAGTTAIQSNGNPYSINTAMPPVTVSDIPSGNWYFFSRMVNSLGSSVFSLASNLFQWRPMTFQYSQRYLSIAYATSASGTGFSANPRGKTYFGISNSNVAVYDPTPQNYLWYPANPVFQSSGTLNYLIFSNRGNNLISFAVGNAALSSGTALFVPTDANYDATIWQGLQDGFNVIDLNIRTGQLIKTGTTTVGTGEIAITNNPTGQVIASLATLLTFPNGRATYTSSVATLTIDRYGRVIGFSAPDEFYYTLTAFNCSGGQTVFNVTRGTEYLIDNCFIFKNGCLLDESEYTDTGGSTGIITLDTGAFANDILTIISFASISSLSILTSGASGTGTVATLNFATLAYVPFIIGQSITVTGVTPNGYNGVYTVTNCTNSSVSFLNATTGSQTVAGTIEPTDVSYRSFTRNSANLDNVGFYTASGFTLVSGNELLFLNGTIINADDYNISDQTISFINSVTGDLQIIQWSNNNLNLPNGTPSNTAINTTIGQSTYPFTYDPNAFNLYNNGVLLLVTVDFSVTVGSYTLAQTPTTNLNVLVEQSFNRTGAV
jgi:hypothetical protein